MGNVRDRPSRNMKFLHATEHMEKAQPLCGVPIIIRGERADVEVSHTGEKRGYLLADLGHRGYIETCLPAANVETEPVRHV